MRPTGLFLVLVLVLALAFAVGGCGDDKDIHALANELGPAAPPPGTPAIVLTPLAPLVTDEYGGSVNVLITLNTAPTNTVTIPLGSSNTAEGIVSSPSVILDGASWDTGVTVTVTGSNDQLKDGVKSYTVSAGAATSTDPDYSGLAGPSLSFVNNDNEELVDAFARGWYNNVGISNAVGVLTDTFTGWDGFNPVNAFLAFDLAGVTGGPAASVKLLLELESYWGFDPQETLTVFPVTTPVFLLINGAGGGAAYFDLQDGNLLFSINIDPTRVGQVGNYTLAPAATADVNAKLGTQIAFGLHITTISGPIFNQEGLGFAFGGEPRTQQLLLIR